jgi:hypothetical protein
MRKLFAVAAGCLVAFALVALFDFVGSVLYPVSGDINTADRATLAALIVSIPLPAKLLMVAGWLASPLGGAWLALRIADGHWVGWLVTLVFLVAGLVNQAMLPHPLWMQICAVAMPLLGGWLAQKLHHKPYPGEPLLG